MKLSLTTKMLFKLACTNTLATFSINQSFAAITISIVEVTPGTITFQATGSLNTSELKAFTLDLNPIAKGFAISSELSISPLISLIGIAQNEDNGGVQLSQNGHITRVLHSSWAMNHYISLDRLNLPTT